MRIEIVERQPSGVCELTGKKETEVWAVRPRGGAVTRVCTARLPEVLRVLSSVPVPQAAASAAREAEPKNRGDAA